MALNAAKWMFNGAYLSNDPSARVCATFGRRNGANEGETLDNNIHAVEKVKNV